MYRLLISFILFLYSVNLVASTDLRPILENRDVVLDQKRAKVIHNNVKYDISNVEGAPEDISITSTKKDYRLILDRPKMGAKFTRVTEVISKDDSKKSGIQKLFSLIRNPRGEEELEVYTSTLDTNGKLISRTECDGLKGKKAACVTITYKKCEKVGELFTEFSSIVEETKRCEQRIKNFNQRFNKFRSIDSELAREDGEEIFKYTDHKFDNVPKVENHKIKAPALSSGFGHVMKVYSYCSKNIGLFKRPESLKAESNNKTKALKN